MVHLCCKIFGDRYPFILMLEGCHDLLWAIAYIRSDFSRYVEKSEGVGCRV
ncbi:hypothetical protein [Anabaena azotica]|uniref:Transposase n=1 Tax=Anabaena azotica FACHB-119 TaxID=947527 RepID=A0ABR8DCP9_9NOST|nr:hypothetical protein [Anabaena azotica]MBD2504977.1 hypothetical protein [Anabaena azotica FACHB-119]